MKIINDANRIKKNILVKIIKAFNKGKLLDMVNYIPVKMRPKSESSSRCCIYKDRAVIKYRVMAAMGIGAEHETDETKTLKEYAIDALNRKECDKEVLSVLDVACQSCIQSQYMITNACRGCIARPCKLNCPRNAIKIINNQAIIDQSKCVNCGKCLNLCPYKAITRIPIPCEEACPVKAIKTDNNNKQFIDFDNCISCGKCMNACPFGAVLERSQIIDVMKAIKNKKKVIAMVAPAIVGQFPGTLEQIAQGMKMLGFHTMEEVAYGAEITTEKETEEFFERMEKGDHLMTTSCCPAYTETIQKHVPELKPFVSDTKSPMNYIAAKIKDEDTDFVTVFIGPCVAKKKEAQYDDNTDFVLTFEELGAMFISKDIEILKLEGIPLNREVSRFARGFATSCGVTSAILEEKLSIKDKELKDLKIDTQMINGFDRHIRNKLKAFAKGKLPGNFLEVMCCENGCVGGPCSIGQVKLAVKAVHNIAKGNN